MRRWLFAVWMGGCNPPVVPQVDDTDVAHEPAGVVAAPLVAPAGDASVRYDVYLDTPETHLVRVEATATVPEGQEVVWMMPVWTPGSYLVREYARNVEDVGATDARGASLDVRKVTKNRWRTAAGQGSLVRMSYVVYAHEWGVRSSFVDADRAILVGASLFLRPVDDDGPFDIVLHLPESWSTSETGLDAHPDGQPHHYRAASFDELIDSPLVAGNPQVHDFEVGGALHRLVNLGGEGMWDQERSAEDVRKVVEVVTDFWGVVPYERYVFLNVLGDGAGGLEHLDSTLMMTRPIARTEDDRWGTWLGLVSHEFFHTWNVKRLRPVGLGPFDYEQEVYTPSLWVAEGLTSYFDDLLLARAGLIDGDEHLARLSKTIQGIQTRPGRRVQSLSMASFDAWIKHYRPDENSVNTSVSYYNKGALVGWLLDIEIRRGTADRRSLDDVLRLLYRRHLVEGYTPEDVRAAASEVAGRDLGPFFDAYVDGVDELDFQPALDWLGLRFAEGSKEDEPVGWLGLETRGGRVSQVERDAPVFEAGLNVGDEVIALDGWRYDDGAWSTLRTLWKPGDTAEVTVARDGRLRTLSVTFAEEPAETWRLTRDPMATSTQLMHRARWWGVP